MFYGVKEDLVHPPAAHIKNKEDRYNLPKGVVLGGDTDGVGAY